MTQPSDRKIMMLNKMVSRLKRQGLVQEKSLVRQASIIAEYQEHVSRLMGRIRGNGAKAPVSEDLLACYNYTLDYVTKAKYKDKSRIAMFKDVKYNETYYPPATVKGQPVVDWAVERLDEGLYDLAFVKEWVY